MSRSKKGFTIVELVIVIAVIAILAAVLIPSFSSLNKKAKDSAYLQERTNQQIADLAEKVENQKFLTWEDLEAKLAEEIAKIEIPADSDLTEAQVTDAIAKAIAKLENSLKTDDTALTEAQVKAIIEKALEGQLTTAQVEAIVKDAVKNVDGSDLTADQVKTIVDAAVAGLDKQTGITKEEMADAIAKAVEGKSELKATDVESIITDALAGFGYGNDLSASQIENIIKNAMAASKDKADDLAAEEMTEVIKAANATEFNKAVEALTAAGYNVSALTPIREGFIFTWDETTKGIVCIEGTTGSIVEEGAGLVVADVATVADFKKAFANGNAITLTADITVPADNNLDLEEGDVTLNLNGYTLNSEQNDSNGRSAVIYIRENAALTVTNGTFNVRSLQNYGDLTIKSDVVINAMDANGGGCIKNKTGNVVIEGGTFNVNNYVPYGQGGAAVVENAGGTVTINGGTFNSKTDLYTVVNLSGTITINDGNFIGVYGCVDAQGGTVTINGGTFENKGTGSGGYHLFAKDGTITYTDTAVFKGVAFDTCVLDGASGSITKK